MWCKGDDGMMARDIGNIRFLIEQQIQLIDELDRRGIDRRDAQDLLRRLLLRDEEVRRLPCAGAARRVA